MDAWNKLIKNFTKKQKRALYHILAGAIVFLVGMLVPDRYGLPLIVNILAFLIVGLDVIKKAVKNISRGQVFDENFLMAIATIGAFLVGEYSEGVAVMLFYQVGELFQSYAVNKSRKSIAALMDIRPDYANVERNGKLVTTDPEEIKIDEIIVVKPGEKVPLDGVVIEGNSTLDTAALTGESVPRGIEAGQDILSGVINLNGVLQIRVTKPFGESTVAKILDLVENASNKKSKSENFITKFARYYTPAVVIAALILAILPPLILPEAYFSDWIHRALIFLVISCPCALVISIPLSFFGGIGGASKAGILVKGSNYLEALSQAEIVVFDKTGTLTKGTFQVTEICPEGVSKEELLRFAAYAESYSNHPISQSLKQAYKEGKIEKTAEKTEKRIEERIEKEELEHIIIEEVEEFSGKGVKAIVEGTTVYVGNRKLMLMQNIAVDERELAGTIVHVALNGRYAGYILIADEIKEDAHEAIQAIRQLGMKRTVMLTGDNKETGEAVAAKLGLNEVYTELLPGDKMDKMEELFHKKSEKGKLVYVGDGINDAPVLTRADIGIAMGALGSDAAIEAADIVIMTDEPSKIADALRISRKTLGIVKQNIIFALGIKGLFLIMGAFGVANMWEAVFADVGVSVIAILNAMRALHYYTPCASTENRTVRLNSD